MICLLQTIHAKLSLVADIGFALIILVPIAHAQSGASSAAPPSVTTTVPPISTVVPRTTPTVAIQPPSAEGAALPHADAAPDVNAVSAEEVQRRITRARSLAAVGSLAAAGNELEAIRLASRDDAVRDVVRILLIGVYLGQADYTRALGLLDESFKARSTQNESSIRAYFALAGQMINGTRTHLDRYRVFGLSLAHGDLSPEAVNDLNRLRLLLEQIVEQARAIRDEHAESTVDAAALLEDAAGLRVTLARDDAERVQWQREVADARQRLVASETRIASIGGGVRLNSLSSLRNADVNTNANTSSAATIIPTNTTAGAVAASPTLAGSTPNNTEAAAKTSSPSSSSGLPAPSGPTGSATTTTSSAPIVSTPASSANATAGAPGSAPPAAASASAASARAAQQKTSAQNRESELPGGNVGGAGGQSLEVGSLLDRATQRAAPGYPQAARTARVSGAVIVYVVVDEKGAVEKVQRTTGPQQLQGAAEEAVRRWKFRPTIINGHPVRVSGYVSFNFVP